MFVFLILMIPVLMTGTGIMNGTILGVPTVYLLLGTLTVSFGCILAVKVHAVSLTRTEGLLIAFAAWGLLYVLLSYVGVGQLLFGTDQYYDSSFIPRQAVYLFVLLVPLLFREDFFTKGLDWMIRHYGEVLFWTLYLLQIWRFNSFQLNIAAQIILGWLSFKIETNQRWRRWLRIAALLLTPFPKDGQSTVLILRLVFLAVCVLPKKQSRIGLRIVAIGVLVILAVCFIAPFAVNDAEVDDFNTAWRLRMWKEELTILKSTCFLGAGYGTSYPSRTFAKESILRGEAQFKAAQGYTEVERAFVTAPHNSYISVAMRTGIVGLGLFLAFLISLFVKLTNGIRLPSKAACYALFAGAMLISFNVGLESPGYLVTFTFCIGCCILEMRKRREDFRAEEAMKKISTSFIRYRRMTYGGAKDLPNGQM